MPPDRTHARKAGVIRVGISGWRYPPWRGPFYPRDLPQRRELEYASRHVATIEINGSFYSLQRPEFYARWRDETPADFVFDNDVKVKAPRDARALANGIVTAGGNIVVPDEAADRERARLIPPVRAAPDTRPTSRRARASASRSLPRPRADR